MKQFAIAQIQDLVWNQKTPSALPTTGTFSISVRSVFQLCQGTVQSTKIIRSYETWNTEFDAENGRIFLGMTGMERKCATSLLSFEFRPCKIFFHTFPGSIFCTHPRSRSFIATCWWLMDPLFLGWEFPRTSSFTDCHRVRSSTWKTPASRFNRGYTSEGFGKDSG